MVGEVGLQLDHCVEAPACWLIVAQPTTLIADVMIHDPVAVGAFFAIVAGSGHTKKELLVMKREKIKLESSAGTGHFYTTDKNKKTTPEKLEMMKFDPKARKHVMYKETKLK